MGTEIERRFRVNLARLCPNGEDGKFMPKGRYIKQAYLTSHDPAIRVRIVGYDHTPMSDPKRIDKAILTIKGTGTIERAEWNIKLAPEDALAMMDFAKQGVIEKIRTEMFVGASQTKWEVDQFLGAHEGLWLAEVELPSADAAFEKPPWLGPEVTEDPRYNNARLAADTSRFWADAV